ncbi:plasmid mobilization relaxosome protein MobC [Shigella flexneri]|nr:plasmid mobilization relaxosome protein MobC [Shigella flexneri]
MELKLTEEEFGLLEALAEAQGVSKQAVLMRAVLTGGPDAAARVDRMRDELRSLRLLLANVANNMNQLARQANAFALGSEEPVSARDVQAVVDDAAKLVVRIGEFSQRASATVERDES